MSRLVHPVRFGAAVAIASLLSQFCFAAESEPALPTNTLTEAERLAGWELLFDGESLEGWRGYQKSDVPKGWQVIDGAIVRVADGAGDLITKGMYDDFELMIEYKISPGGNSGIIFHATEDNPASWHSGPEIQILDNGGAHEGQKAGWLYQLYSPRRARWQEHRSGTLRGDEEGRAVATRPAGQWNSVYFRVSDKQCAVYMNGYPYYTFEIGSKEWNQRVAKSKFAQYEGFGEAEKGHICLQDHNARVAFRNIKIRILDKEGGVPNPVHGTLDVKPVPAFPELEFTGWNAVTPAGKVREFRPVVLTHPGDGSDRLFVCTQRGVIHSFKNRPDAQKTKIFLDIQKKVADFTDKGANEEGLLGLAFHPNYEENGKFYIYYTLENPPQTSIISEYRVSEDNPNKADPESERVLLRIQQPYTNHNGGSIAFGPDGYLYIGLGDGGLAFDPYRNGQNPMTLLGSILRIDVDQKSPSMGYGIPEDNPFVGKPGRDEIYAYGIRNSWRISFDRKTGNLWTGDVGQALFEEIDIIKKGGNYGWNGREGFHPFGDWSTQGSAPIPPVWEYDHQVGKSITGGVVYRGPGVPELDGYYLYADYVSGKLWALKIDPESGKATKNLAIPTKKAMTVISYGEDAAGEAYFTVGTTSGNGIYRFESGD